jgi:hypothetical protein
MGGGQSHVLSLMENWSSSTRPFTAKAYTFLRLQSNPVH